MMLNRFRRTCRRAEKKRRNSPARRRTGLQQLEQRLVLASDLLSVLQSYAGHAAGTVQPGEVTVGSASDPMLDMNSPTLTFDGSGGVTISGDAKLFPDATKFTATVDTLSGSYNYSSGGLSLSAAQAEFSVGNMLDVAVTSPMFTFNNGTWSFSDSSATAKSQQFAPNASVNVNGLSITNGGISFSEADIKNSGNLTLDNVLQIDNPELDVKGFTYTAAIGTSSASFSAASAGISAASASLFPGNSAFTATVDNFNGNYNFSNNALTLQADDAHIAVGKIIDVKAISPSFSLDGSGKLTIGVTSATATSPDFPGAEGDVTNLAITDTGVSFSEAKLTDNSLTLDNVLEADTFKLDVKGFTYTTGNGLSVSDAAISAASASLFPGNSAFTATVDNFNGSYNFSNNALTLQADDAHIAVGKIIDVKAISPSFSLDGRGKLTIGVASATATSPDFPGAEGDVTNLAITDTGVSFDEAKLTDDNLTLGNVLQVTGFQFDVKGFAYTAAAGLSATSANISAGKVDLSIGSGAATGSVTGFAGSYNFSTGDLSMSATDVNFSVSDVLTVDAQSFTFQLNPFQITAASASATSPRFSGVGGTVDNLVINSDGFSFKDATLGATGTVNLGSVFTFTNLQFSLTNFGYSTSHGAAFGVYDPSTQTFNDSVFTVTADLAALNIGSAFTASATTINGQIDLSAASLGAFSFSAGSVKIDVGSYLALNATQVSFDPGATGSTDIADFGSIDAKVNVGGLSIDGSAKNFGIDSSGHFVAKNGFGVSFSVGGSSGNSSDSVSSGINWPSWLPIQISQLALNWTDFADKPLDFTIDVSASVNITGLGGTNVNLSGFVDNAVIDVGLLSEGKFPLVGLGGVGIAASGSLFGAQISGQFFMATLQEDKNGNVIPDGNPNGQTVASSTLYGGIDASIDLGGDSGFQVRLGVSQLGPLQAYVSVADPQILEPISGLALTDFAAGIQFDSTLPEISDPRQMANEPDFTPSSQLTLLQWKSLLQTAVENQVAVAQNGGGLWAEMSQPMTMEGGVTLFDAYATGAAFELKGDFKFDTVGHFFAQGDLTLGGTLNLPVDLYFDASKLGQGTGSILVYAKTPSQTPLMTMYGALKFDFGTQLNTLNQNSTTGSVGPQLGTAVQLNGTSQYITAPNIDLNQTTTANPASFTVELWAQRQDKGRAQTLVAENNGLQLGFDGNDNLTVAYGGTSILSFATTADKLWHDYAVSFDATSGTFVLYVDGAAVKQTTLTLPLSLGTAGSTLYLGSQATNGGSGFFDGSIDEVRVWNVVRSAADIAAHMNGPISDPTLLTKLLGYWQFEDGSGTTASDSSPNGNVAQLIGSPVWIEASVSNITPVTVTSFNVSIDGGIDLTAPSVGGVYVTGTADFSVAQGMTAMDLTVTGSMGLDSVGSLLNVSGAAHLDLSTPAAPEFWGAFQLQTGDLSSLEQLGINASGTAIFRFNTDGTSHTITLPSASQSVTIPAQSMQLYVNGSADFKQGGSDWFQIQGTLVADLHVISSTSTNVTDSKGNIIDDANGQPLQVTTDAFQLDVLLSKCTLSVGPASSPYATFGVNGFMQIADSGPDAGIAAEMDVTLNGSKLGSSSVSVTANFFMELNTTGKEVTYTIPTGFPIPKESTNGAIDIPAGPIDASGNEGAAGPYLVINGNGSVTISSNYKLQGKFDLLVSTTQVAADFDANLTLGSLGTLVATGSIDVSSAGVVGMFGLSLPNGSNLGGTGFSIDNANFELAVNTTGSKETVTGFTVDPTTGNVTTNQQMTLAPQTVEVIVGGDLSLTNHFDIKGEVDLTESSGAVNAIIDASVDAGSIGTLTFAGSLNVSSAGIVGVVGLSLSSSKSLSASGFNINNAQFQLAANTTGSAKGVTGFTVDPSTGNITPNQRFRLDGGAVEVMAAGDLSFKNSFDLKGEFDFKESSGSWTIYAQAAVKVPDLGTLDGSGSLTVDSSGLWGYLTLGTPDLNPGSGFSLSGTFTLEANTQDPKTGATEPVNGDKLAPGTVEVKVNGDLNAGGFDVNATDFDLSLSSGSVTVSLANGSVTLGSLGTLTVSGSLTITDDGHGASEGVYGDLIAGTSVSLAGGDFSIKGNTEVDLNTTSSPQGNLPADTVRVHVAGTAQLQKTTGSNTANSFLISGTFDLTEQPGSFDVSVTNATVALAGLGKVSVSGDLSASSAGLWGDLAVTLSSSFTPSGFSLSGTMQLEANTTGVQKTVLARPIDPTTGTLGNATNVTLDPYTVELALGGNVAFAGSFTVAGELDLTMNGSAVDANLNANVTIFSVPLTVSGSINVRSNGTIWGSVDVSAGGNGGLSLADGLFTISAGATFTFDTGSDSASFSLHAPDDANSPATVSFLGITASGNLTVSYSDGLARISVPDRGLSISVPDFVQRAGAAVLEHFFDTDGPFDPNASFTIYAGGFFQSDGQFELTVSGGSSTGTQSYSGNSGSAGGFQVTIGNFTGSVLTGYSLSVNTSNGNYTVTPNYTNETFQGFSAAVWAFGWVQYLGATVYGGVTGGVTISGSQFDFNLGATSSLGSANVDFDTGVPNSTWTTPPVVDSFSPTGLRGPSTTETIPNLYANLFPGQPKTLTEVRPGQPLVAVNQGTAITPTMTAHVPGGTLTVFGQTYDLHPLKFSNAIYLNGNLLSSSQPASASNDQYTAPAFIPLTPGTYKVLVTATDSASGLATSETGDVVVNDVPPADASIYMPSRLQLGGTVNPIVTSTDPEGNILHYAWTVLQHGSVVASSNGLAFSFKPTAAGLYTVQAVVSDLYGGSTTTSTTLSVVDPTAGLSLTDSGGAPQDTPITFTVSGGKGLTYSYDFLNNGQFEISGSSNASASHSYAQPGTYVVHVQVTKPGTPGVTDYYTQPFIVADAPPTIANLSVRTGTLGQSVAASVDGRSPANNALTVSWSVSPDTFAQFNTNASSVEFVPQKAGVYSVTAEVSDQYGGTATMTKSLVVSPANAPQALDNDGPDAENSTATVFFTRSGPGATYSFDFLNDGSFSDPGDVANSSTPYATYTFATPGSHTVHGRIKTSTGTVTDYFTTVTVQDVPPSNVAIAMPGGINLGTDATASASYDNPGNNTETIAWTVTSPGGTQVASGNGASFDFTPSSAGTYTVDALVSDAYGGSANQTAKLIVTDPTAGLTFASAGPLKEGSPSTVAFSGGDPNAGLTYSFDFLDDASFSDAGDAANSTTATGSHTFSEEGTYVVHGRVSAPGNVHTDYLTTLTVSDPAVQVQPVAVQGTEGAATGLVTAATFTDPGGAENVSDYSATIDWGDGSTTAGTVVTSGGSFSVEGNHTYSNAGAFAVNVSVNHDQAPAASAQATATIAVVPLTVSNMADNNAPATAGSAPLTLRDAINTFNAKGGTNEIDLLAGTYSLTQSASRAAPGTPFGALLVGNEDLIIRGAGAGQTIINASALGDRVFDVLASGSLHLIDVSITGGNSTKDGAGGTSFDTYGGGILNQGTLTLDRVDVTGNRAGGNGGGVESFNASTTISDSTIENNSAQFGGGLSDTGGNVQIVNSTFSRNKANNGGAVDHFGGQFSATGDSFAGNGANNGGAIYFDALTGDGNANNIANSTFSGNSAAQSGGAIDNASANVLTLSDSTLAANDANSGGAIYSSGSLTVNGGTFSGNRAGTAGAIDNTSSNAVKLINTLVAHGPNSTADLSGLFNASYSLIQAPPQSGVTADSHTLLNVDPLLAPLGNYGGPTQTMALLPGSPAINAGTRAGIPATDQRGKPRASENQVDIGAFESSGFDLAVSGGNSQSVTLNTSFASPLAVTIKPLNPQEPVAGGQISFSDPSSGASASLSAGTVRIAADGTANVTASSNTGVGKYEVTANAAGAFHPALFELANKDIAPVVTNAGGPYFVGGEQGSLLLAAKVLDPDPGQTLTVRWDLNGDGTPDVTGTAASNGSTVTVQAFVSSATLKALGLFNGNIFFAINHFTVQVTASDGFLNSAAVTTALTTERGPEGGLKNDGPVLAGQPVDAQIFVPAGVSIHGPLHFSIALNQNDVAATYADAGTNDTQSFTFAKPGPYTIYGRMFQADGAFSDYTTTIDVYAAGQQNEVFVDRTYSDLLGRASSPYGPDSAGSAYWTAQIDNGVSRQDVALAIMSGDEYDANQVQAAFQQYLHRAADPQALDYFVPALQAGLSVEQLDIDLVSSDEYLNSRGGGTNDGFLDALFGDALGRAVDSGARAAFDGMLAGGISRAQVADMVFGSTEYEDRLVENMFESLLNRPADPAALDFFAAELSSGLTDQQVMAQIIGSEEFAPLA